MPSIDWISYDKLPALGGAWRVNLKRRPLPTKRETKERYLPNGAYLAKSTKKMHSWGGPVYAIARPLRDAALPEWRRMRVDEQHLQRMRGVHGLRQDRTGCQDRLFGVQAGRHPDRNE